MTTTLEATDTGLRRGDPSKIARKLGYSVQHVIECAKGNRVPAKPLAREIERLRARRARESEATTQVA